MAFDNGNVKSETPRPHYDVIVREMNVYISYGERESDRESVT